MSKKVIISVVASVMVVAVAVAVAVYFLVLKEDIVDVDASETPFGITWDTTFEDAKKMLTEQGFDLDEERNFDTLCGFIFKDLNGIKGADGHILLHKGLDDKLMSITIHYSDKIDKEINETIVNSYKAAFDEKISFNVTTEENNAMSGSVYKYDVFETWIGGTSMVSLTYDESKPITLIFDPATSEFAEELLNYFQ